MQALYAGGQQQQQQVSGAAASYPHPPAVAAPPDPARLAALAGREQQLLSLQGVRLELERVRLLADQVRRREKIKHQVGVLCWFVCVCFCLMCV